MKNRPPAPRKATVATPPYPTATSATVPQRWLVVALFAATLLAYWPSLSGGFLWDDDGHVTKKELRSIDGLVRIWTEPQATQQYYPLLHSAFWLEYRLWDGNPLGYRVLNLLLHATTACLFAALLRRLQVPGAWLAAFIFALHPVCVESVAWISEQKNTLSLVLYLLAALAYLRFDERRQRSHYLIASTLFVAALLSKTVTATLPAALLVVLWWKRGRLDFRRDLAPLSLWFALGIAAGLITMWAERTMIGARGDEFAFSFLERCLIAGRVVWFYLGKLFWPAELIFIYPRWTIDAAQLTQWLFPIGGVAATAALSWFAWKKSRRGPLAAWLLFVGTLVPALGFFNVYPFVFSFVADHFQYHACLAIVALAAAGLSGALARLPRGVTIGATVAVVALLAHLSRGHSAIYVSNLTLFEATVAKNPAAWMAHSNLGTTLNDHNRSPEALIHLQTAHDLRPDAEAKNNLGYTLTRLGRPAEAVAYLEQALALRPTFAAASNNLGIAYVALRRNSDAVAAFQAALRLQPHYPAARLNLGLAIAQSGRTEEAVAHFRQALELDPNYADAELHLGLGLTLLGKFPEGRPHFERSLRLNPYSFQNVHTYARALENVGQLTDAIVRYRQALDLAPDHPDVHADLARALRQNGQVQEANTHQAEASRLRRGR
jgi:protein O-mannosyl-transferase